MQQILQSIDARYAKLVDSKLARTAECTRANIEEFQAALNEPLTEDQKVFAEWVQCCDVPSIKMFKVLADNETTAATISLFPGKYLMGMLGLDQIVRVYMNPDKTTYRVVDLSRVEERPPRILRTSDRAPNTRPNRTPRHDSPRPPRSRVQEKTRPILRTVVAPKKTVRTTDLSEFPPLKETPTEAAPVVVDTPPKASVSWADEEDD
jgi:hypothetical protein